MSTIIDDLIFDRTDSDLETAKAYVKNNQPFPNDNLRYAWDNRALNRTEQAMKYVDDIFKELGYFKNMEFKTNWSNEEITPSEANRYIENLRTLREFILMPSTTPPAPNTINGMSIERANDIEKIIHDIDIVLNGLQNNLIYCGVSNMGQDRVWQQRFRRKQAPIVKQLLKYVQNTGENYFDTGVAPTSTTKIKIRFQLAVHPPSGSFCIFGEYTQNNRFRFYLSTTYNKYSVQFKSSTTNSLEITTSTDDVIDIEMSNANLKINGTVVKTFTSSLSGSTYSMYLFGSHTSSGNQWTTSGQGKIYSCQIYNGDTLIRDFVPVIDLDDKVCLFDKCESKFYYNKGTGDFIAGT